jgi:hypothetical protein
MVDYIVIVGPVKRIPGASAAGSLRPRKGRCLGVLACALEDTHVSSLMPGQREGRVGPYHASCGGHCRETGRGAWGGCRGARFLAGPRVETLTEDVKAPPGVLQAGGGGKKGLALSRRLLTSNAADTASGHLLARTLGFDPALLEESERLFVEFVLSTGVPTTLEAFVLVGSDLLHHHQATCCAPPVGYRSATLRKVSGNRRELRAFRYRVLAAVLCIFSSDRARRGG